MFVAYFLSYAEFFHVALMVSQLGLGSMTVLFLGLLVGFRHGHSANFGSINRILSSLAIAIEFISLSLISATTPIAILVFDSRGVHERIAMILVGVHEGRHSMLLLSLRRVSACGATGHRKQI